MSIAYEAIQNNHSHFSSAIILSYTMFQTDLNILELSQNVQTLKALTRYR